jgi:lantibiotic biosynthesis protein
MTAWCHGAAGIAFSRVRAYEILRDDRFKVESMCALETTRESITQSLTAPDSNFCMCHGIAGNADALLYGSEVFGSDAASYIATALKAGYTGIEAYGNRGAVWPCGEPGEYSPGLMTGLAGIGYFYLRLHDGSVPSVLLFKGSRLACPKRTDPAVISTEPRRRSHTEEETHAGGDRREAAAG